MTPPPKFWPLLLTNPVAPKTRGKWWQPFLISSLIHAAGTLQPLVLSQGLELERFAFLGSRQPGSWLGWLCLCFCRAAPWWMQDRKSYGVCLEPVQDARGKQDVKGKPQRRASAWSKEHEAREQSLLFAFEGVGHLAHPCPMVLFIDSSVLRDSNYFGHRWMKYNNILSFLRHRSNSIMEHGISFLLSLGSWNRVLWQYLYIWMLPGVQVFFKPPRLCCSCSCV